MQSLQPFRFRSVVLRMVSAPARASSEGLLGVVRGRLIPLRSGVAPFLCIGGTIAFPFEAASSWSCRPFAFGPTRGPVCPLAFSAPRSSVSGEGRFT
jgi:hypothetical protein